MSTTTREKYELKSTDTRKSWHSEELEKLREIIPQQYGEALMAGLITTGDCSPEEWDNRTTVENAVWWIKRHQNAPPPGSCRFNYNESLH